MQGKGAKESRGGDADAGRLGKSTLGGCCVRIEHPGGKLDQDRGRGAAILLELRDAPHRLAAEIETLKGRLTELLAGYDAVAVDGISSRFRVGDHHFKHEALWHALGIASAGPQMEASAL